MTLAALKAACDLALTAHAEAAGAVAAAEEAENAAMRAVKRARAAERAAHELVRKLAGMIEAYRTIERGIRKEEEAP